MRLFRSCSSGIISISLKTNELKRRSICPLLINIKWKKRHYITTRAPPTQSGKKKRHIDVISPSKSAIEPSKYAHFLP